ncbi:MAG: methylated-DNA--[protein]-cysteine S-methyltransferase [Lachnospiraceae bacterium]|nr:methylated-DNA--[protein]-cysteine S-methyltransferase [Lachnospiraceae bacterium]
MEYTNEYVSPLGKILLASDGHALTGLWFEGQKYFAAKLDPDHEEKKLPVFARTAEWLALYFDGEKPAFIPPLTLKGTPFQKEVWEILLEIPFGQTTTYAEIAAEIARRRGLASMSAQAVGSAVAHNPISLIIPCHRVVGSDGSLTGYAGGIEKKEWLLAMERQAPESVI